MSSYNNSIKFSLGTEDSNIIFEDYFYRIDHGIKQKIYQAVLIQPACPYCGSVSLVHNGRLKTEIRYLTANASRPVIINREYCVGTAKSAQWLSLIWLINTVVSPMLLS